MKLHQQVVAADGADINVASAGAGKPIVLLHGFPDTHTVWLKQIAPLVEAGYRVIAPDLRGYGASSVPKGVDAYSLAKLRADVIAVLDEFDIERAYVVGHDWGAMLGWQLCMHAPKRVERFAALSVGHPNSYAQAGIGQRLLAWYAALFQLPGLSEAMIKAGKLMILKQYAANAEQAAEWEANFAGEGRLTAALNYYRANRALFLPGAYPDVVTPVMGVWSQGDPALTERQMRDSSKFVSAPFRYERIGGKVGHWMQLTAAEQVSALLLQFGTMPFAH